MKNDDVILLCDHNVFQGKTVVLFYGLYGFLWPISRNMQGIPANYLYYFNAVLFG